jgi:hypothetical protein
MPSKVQSFLLGKGWAGTKKEGTSELLSESPQFDLSGVGSPDWTMLITVEL